jgi:MFS family permease
MSGAGIAERTAGTQRIARRGYAVVFMLFLFQTLNFFDKLVFGLSAVPIMKELQISPKQFGLIGSAFFLLFSATGTLVGLFATSRVRAKWIIVALALIWSAAQLPIFFAGSLTVLVACRILLGAGEGPGLPTALHACYDWFPANRRSVPSAIILQGISAGFLIGGPLLTYVIRGYGWRGAFLFCGLLSLVWLVAWLVIGGTGPYAATREVAADTSRNVPGRMLWLDPTIVGVMIMSFMSYWVVGMAATWLPPYLQLGLHYSQVNVGWIITGVFAFQSPLLLAGAWVCQRMQLRGVSPRASLGHFSMVARGGACRRRGAARADRVGVRRPEPDHDLGAGVARRRFATRAARDADRGDLLGQCHGGAGVQLCHRGDRRGGGAGCAGGLRDGDDGVGRGTAGGCCDVPADDLSGADDRPFRGI